MDIEEEIKKELMSALSTLEWPIPATEEGKELIIKTIYSKLNDIYLRSCRND